MPAYARPAVCFPALNGPCSQRGLFPLAEEQATVEASRLGAKSFAGSAGTAKIRDQRAAAILFCTPPLNLQLLRFSFSEDGRTPQRAAEIPCSP